MAASHGLRAGFLALVLSIALGCDDGFPEDLPEATGTPLALDDTLLYLAHDGQERPVALLADMGSKRPLVRRVPLGAGEASLLARPASDEALVLTSGQAGGRDDRGNTRDPIAARLTRLAPSGLRADYELSGRLFALSVSDDGNYAVAFGEGDAFQLALALAVIDLREDGDDAVDVLSFDGSTVERPRGFVIAPHDAPRRLAASARAGALTVIDLAAPERGTLEVLLAGAGTAADLWFVGDVLYARVPGQDALSVVSFEADATANAGLVATVKTLAVGGQVVDLASAGDALVVLHSQGLTAFDGSGAEATALALDAAFQHVVLFQQGASTHALLYGRNATLGLVDLAAPVLQKLDLGSEPQAVTLFAERNLAVVQHRTGRLNLVDLAAGTLAPVNTVDQPREILLDDARGRLWIATASGRVGCLTLASRVGREILLDAPTTGMALLGDEVALVHESVSGHVTLVSAEDPKREGARELEGFLWSGLFD